MRLISRVARAAKAHLVNAALLSLMTVLLLACGYSFKHQGSDALPQEMRTLYIDSVANPTTEAWLGPRIRAQLRDELSRRSWTKWVKRSEADGMIAITIKQFTRSSSVTDENDDTTKYTSAVVFSATITDRVSGKTVWSSGDVSGDERYYGTDSSLEQTADEAAVVQAVRQMADLLSEGY